MEGLVSGPVVATVADPKLTFGTVAKRPSGCFTPISFEVRLRQLQPLGAKSITTMRRKSERPPLDCLVAEHLFDMRAEAFGTQPRHPGSRTFTRMPKIDIHAAPTCHGSDYPVPYDAPCQSAKRWRLGDAAGLTQFGVNLLRLPADGWSNQRHWHTAEDEFVYVLEGEVLLVDDDGETLLRTGDCAGFKAGEPIAHHLQNRSNREAVILEVGSRRPLEDAGTYPDIDLAYGEGATGYQHKNGHPFST